MSSPGGPLVPQRTQVLSPDYQSHYPGGSLQVSVICLYQILIPYVDISATDNYAQHRLLPDYTDPYHHESLPGLYHHLCDSHCHDHGHYGLQIHGYPAVQDTFVRRVKAVNSKGRCQHDIVGDLE